jgi:hypothetical protein
VCSPPPWMLLAMSCRGSNWAGLASSRNGIGMPSITLGMRFAQAVEACCATNVSTIRSAAVVWSRARAATDFSVSAVPAGLMIAFDSVMRAKNRSVDDAARSANAPAAITRAAQPAPVTFALVVTRHRHWQSNFRLHRVCILCMTAALLHVAGARCKMSLDPEHHRSQ